MNIYEKSMFEVCKVLQTYSKKGKFAVYGFGGVPNYVNKDGQIKEELKSDLEDHIDE